MSGSIRLTGVNGLPLGGSGLRYPGVYAALDFANNVYELGGVSRRALTALPGFTFTRASLAMGYDATGKLTYGPNNLCLQSQALGTSPWGVQYAGTGSTPVVTNNYAAAPDGTMTATRVQVALNGGTAAADQSYPVQGCTCPTARGSFYVKTNDGSTKTIYVRGSFAATKVVTGAWTRIDFDAGTLSATQFGIGLRGGQASPCSDSADLLVWGAQLEAVTYQTTPSTYYPTTTAAYYGPRLVYDPVTLASLGILVEEARTNLCLQSQAFGTTWVLSNGTLTANSAVSPDGTTTADTLVGTAASSQGRLAQSFAGSIGATYTLSCYVKSAGGTLARLYFDDNATNAASVTYDSITGAVSVAASASGGNWTAVSSTAQQLGSGWWRFSLTFTATTVAPQRVVLFHRDVSDGTNGIYLWQAQLEQAVGASSPIPTTTASVTRAADAATLSGLSAAAPYSAVSEFNIPRTASGVDIINWGTLANGGGQYVVSSGNAWVRESSSTTANVAGGTVTANAAQKMASRYAVNDVNISVNGGIATADTSVTPPTISTLGLGPAQVSFGGIYPNGTISRIRVYNRALSDAQLQSLTS